MMNKKISIKLFLFLAILCFAVNSPAQNQINTRDTKKLAFSDSIVQQVMSFEKEKIIKRADKYINEKPRTVTASISPASKGGKHDFFSEGPYWWPDPAHPEGPYIRHDGLRYPGRFQDHDNDLRQFSWIVGTETSAYLLTGKEEYVKAAMAHLKAWFIDTATLMNPNMLYAQAIKGICTGRGVGIIDAGQLMDVAQSVIILEKSQRVSRDDIGKIKEWFRQFITWLTTHPYGVEEMNAKNNHGSWWHAQVASYARLTGDEKILQMCFAHYREILLPGQMASDGSYPEELARTKPYSYSLFNLDATASLLWILSDKTFDAWNYSLSDGRSLWKGLDYMLPYLRDKSIWPGTQDVDHWEEQPEARQFMIFAALAGNNAVWFNLWKSLAEKNSNDDSRKTMMLKNPLLWINLK